jgi:hypothetical protein
MPPTAGGGKKWALYSGLFILLKESVNLSRTEWARIYRLAWMAFLEIR